MPSGAVVNEDDHPTIRGAVTDNWVDVFLVVLAVVGVVALLVVGRRQSMMLLL